MICQDRLGTTDKKTSANTTHRFTIKIFLLTEAVTGDVQHDLIRIRGEAHQQPSAAGGEVPRVPIPSNPVINDVMYISIGLNGSKYRGKLKYSGGTGGIYDVLAGAGTGSPCS